MKRCYSRTYKQYSHADSTEDMANASSSSGHSDAQPAAATPTKRKMAVSRPTSAERIAVVETVNETKIVIKNAPSYQRSDAEIRSHDSGAAPSNAPLLLAQPDSSLSNGTVADGHQTPSSMVRHRSPTVRQSSPVIRQKGTPGRQKLSPSVRQPNARQESLLRSQSEGDRPTNGQSSSAPLHIVIGCEPALPSTGSPIVLPKSSAKSPSLSSFGRPRKIVSREYPADSKTAKPPKKLLQIPPPPVFAATVESSASVPAVSLSAPSGVPSVRSSSSQPLDSHVSPRLPHRLRSASMYIVRKPTRPIVAHPMGGPADAAVSADANGSELRHDSDRHCWICHKPDATVACSYCPRSRHARCTKSVVETQRDGRPVWRCKECELAALVTGATTKYSAGELKRLLFYVVHRCRMVSGLVFPQREIARRVDKARPLGPIWHPMDLEVILQRIGELRYRNTRVFDSDMQWLYHNLLAAGYAKNSHEYMQMQSMLKACRTDLDDIEKCPECFLNMCTSERTWFVKCCAAQPHILLWAKVRGYTYWPAKAMALNANGSQVDVWFFGRHDRARVPVRDCYLYSDGHPHGKSTASMSESLREIGEHIDNIRARFGSFAFAALQTPYSPQLEIMDQLETMVPGIRTHWPRQDLTFRFVKGADNSVSMVKKPTEPLSTAAAVAYRSSLAGRPRMRERSMPPTDVALAERALPAIAAVTAVESLAPRPSKKAWLERLKLNEVKRMPAVQPMNGRVSADATPSVETTTQPVIAGPDGESLQPNGPRQNEQTAVQSTTADTIQTTMAQQTNAPTVQQTNAPTIQPNDATNSEATVRNEASAHPMRDALPVSPQSPQQCASVADAHDELPPVESNVTHVQLRTVKFAPMTPIAAHDLLTNSVTPVVDVHVESYPIVISDAAATPKAVSDSTVPNLVNSTAECIVIIDPETPMKPKVPAAHTDKPPVASAPAKGAGRGRKRGSAVKQMQRPSSATKRVCELRLYEAIMTDKKPIEPPPDVSSSGGHTTPAKTNKRSLKPQPNEKQSSTALVKRQRLSTPLVKPKRSSTPLDKPKRSSTPLNPNEKPSATLARNDESAPISDESAPISDESAPISNEFAPVSNEFDPLQLLTESFDASVRIIESDTTQTILVIDDPADASLSAPATEVSSLLTAPASPEAVASAASPEASAPESALEASAPAAAPEASAPAASPEAPEASPEAPAASPEAPEASPEATAPAESSGAFRAPKPVIETPAYSDALRSMPAWSTLNAPSDAYSVRTESIEAAHPSDSGASTPPDSPAIACAPVGETMRSASDSPDVNVRFDRLNDNGCLRSELERTRTELNRIRCELERKSALDLMRPELARRSDLDRRTVQAAKCGQWCRVCQAVATFTCCWNTSFCSAVCEELFWPMHEHTCGRRRHDGHSTAINMAHVEYAANPHRSNGEPIFSPNYNQPSK